MKSSYLSLYAIISVLINLSVCGNIRNGINIIVLHCQFYKRIKTMSEIYNGIYLSYTVATFFILPKAFYSDFKTFYYSSNTFILLYCLDCLQAAKINLQRFYPSYFIKQFSSSAVQLFGCNVKMQYRCNKRKKIVINLTGERYVQTYERKTNERNERI